jgi:hypothetical protein
MPLAALARRALVVLAVLCLVACGGGGSDEGSDDTADVDELSPVPDPLESLAEPPPGQGVAVIGIDELSFTVTRCVEGPEPGDTPEATLDYLVEGTGETSDAGAFTVEVSRYRSATGDAEPIVTETARVVFGEGDAARGIEAKRTTTGIEGTWRDLTDPDATGPLVDRRDDAVDVEASFGPEGAVQGEEGIEEGRIRAACPA